MDNFTYEGWTFRREQNGNLIIEPGQQNSKGSGGSEVFGEPKQGGNMQPITIPHNEVYRLVGYCLTGDLSNQDVLQSVKQIESQHSLVKT